MKRLVTLFFIFLIVSSCQTNTQVKIEKTTTNQTSDVLNYHITPKTNFDKSGLMFSDQGAWFAYSFQDSINYTAEAEILKSRIQNQFYDEKDGWFYDTNLEENTFIKGEGSEGWTALWANAATQEQAESVKNNMMNPNKFYTKVPFQTMSADHEKFNPLNGYWRGPNWLDQAYFGVKALRNYGFNEEADKATIQILEGAEGVLEKGKSIRENYHPITGKGLNAENFSWSAAHIIMLLMKIR